MEKQQANTTRIDMWLGRLVVLNAARSTRISANFLDMFRGSAVMLLLALGLVVLPGWMVNGAQAVETGTVSLTLTPDNNPITSKTGITVDVLGTNVGTPKMAQWGINDLAWTEPATAPLTYTPADGTWGTIYFSGSAPSIDNPGDTVSSTTLTRAIDVRVNTLTGVSATASQYWLRGIKANFAYIDDKNSTGTFKVEWKLSTDGTYPAENVLTASDGNVVPTSGLRDSDFVRNEKVSVVIGNLTNGQSYTVRMTFIDGTDGLTSAFAPVVQTVTLNASGYDDPMLHNSNRFACSEEGYGTQASCEAAGGVWNYLGSCDDGVSADEATCVGGGGIWTAGKWGTAGWGVAGGKYGAFTCETCHVKGASNIKRVRSSISFPDNSAMPNTLTSSPVTLTTAVDGSSGLGDDSDNHTSSVRPCEVCHSRTNYHSYNTTWQTQGTKTHQNKVDCVKCHQHHLGFRASCSTCHDSPPLNDAGLVYRSNPVNDTLSRDFGKHQVHAETQDYDCDTCHSGWASTGQMPAAGNLNIGFKPTANAQFASAIEAVDWGTYDGRSSSKGYTSIAGTLVTTGNTMTCAVYCHGYARPNWSSAVSNQPCGSCHGKVGAYGDERDGIPDGSAGGGGKDLLGRLTGEKVGKHFKHMTYSAQQTGDNCNLCHDGFGYGVPTHVDGVPNLALRQRSYTSNYASTLGGAGLNATFDRSGPAGQVMCKNMDCHSDTYWDSANTMTCSSGCHSYPPMSTAPNDLHAPGVTAVNHDIRGDGDATALKNFHLDCATCHGYKNNGETSINGFIGLTQAEVKKFGGDWTNSTFINNLTWATGSYHRNALVEMNGGWSTLSAVYNKSNGGCDNATCHDNDAAHRMPVSGSTWATNAGLAIGPGGCDVCHAYPPDITSTAQYVWASSTHVSPGIGYALGDCLGCHGKHWSKTAVAGNNRIGISTIYKRTATATMDVGVKVPTMNKQFESHNSYINLGGTNTSGTTEAGMCWGCHLKQTPWISEWGTHTDAVVAHSTGYDYGSLYVDNTPSATMTLDWTKGYWRSGLGRDSGSTSNPYWYKRGKIQSTHSVNFDTGKSALTTTGNSMGFGRKENPDAIQDIRCTWCHDVHGTHNGTSGDTGGTGTADRPYLRGTWWSNPYAEDGAPQLGMENWTVQNSFGIVPRVSASTSNTGRAGLKKAGGWWIDQNSNNPTTLIPGANAQIKAANSSGLCAQCHSSKTDGTWLATDIDKLDWATNSTGEGNVWVSGYNGHKNSVLGASGSSATDGAERSARNIFSRTKRGTSTLVTTSGTIKSTVDMGMASVTGGIYSYRSSASDGLQWRPRIVGCYSNWAYAWGTAGNIQTTTKASRWATGSSWLTVSKVTPETYATAQSQQLYHTFTCSKCHNPHASRLPKLMITNCLDTNHNTWEDSTGMTWGGNWTAANARDFYNKRHSQFASAQNCHRLDATAAKTSNGTIKYGAGWNRVTPWLEFQYPNSTRANITPDIAVP